MLSYAFLDDCCFIVMSTVMPPVTGAGVWITACVVPLSALTGHLKCSSAKSDADIILWSQYTQLLLLLLSLLLLALSIGMLPGAAVSDLGASYLEDVLAPQEEDLQEEDLE